MDAWSTGHNMNTKRYYFGAKGYVDAAIAAGGITSYGNPYPKTANTELWDGTNLATSFSSDSQNMVALATELSLDGTISSPLELFWPPAGVGPLLAQCWPVLVRKSQRESKVVEENVARQAFKLAAAKLPFQTQFVIRTIM